MKKYTKYIAASVLLLVLGLGLTGCSTQDNIGITTKSNLVTSGNLSVGGTASVSGATTVSSLTSNESTTTTLVIGTANTGCLKMGNSNGSTTVPVYITVTGSTVTATTTKPGICK